MCRITRAILVVAATLLCTCRAHAELIQFQTSAYWKSPTYTASSGSGNWGFTIRADYLSTFADPDSSTPTSVPGLRLLHEGQPAEGLFHIDTEITLMLSLREGYPDGPISIYPTGPVAAFEIAGVLKGDLAGRDYSTLTLTFPDEPSVVRLDEHLYHVRLGSVAVPAWEQGSVDIPREVVMIEKVPEPSTLALAASALGLLVCRKRVFRRSRG